MLNVVVHAADIQDRDGAPCVLDRRTRRLFPFIVRIFGDGGNQGPRLAGRIARTGSWRIEVVKRPDIPRFVVLPKRWIVERTLAWISRNWLDRFAVQPRATSSVTPERSPPSCGLL
jgi:putative transposase